jgi:hypothetical protein
VIGLAQSEEQAVERLTLRLIEDAYYDLAAVVQGAQPQAAAALLAVMEQRVTDVLTGVCRTRAEGERSDAIALAVGERVAEIMDQAHGRRSPARAA